MTFTIQSIKFQPYRFAFHQPFKTALGTYSHRQGFMIKISDRHDEIDKHIGLGEAAPLEGFGMESLAETEETLRLFQRSLMNGKINAKIQNVGDIENLLATCDRTPAAKHGLELALLNLLAQVQNISLSQLLVNWGKLSVPVDAVTVNAVIGAIAPQLAATTARAYLDQGYRCLKIKVGDKDFASDLLRIAAVRSQVNQVDPHIQIRLDANQAWSVSEAIANLKELEKKLEYPQIEYVEQPVAASDLLGMAQVRRSQSIPIAADESVNSLTQLQKVIEAEAADIIILKPMALGGILTAYHGAAIAFDAGLDVVVTTTLDGAIARQAAFALAASLPIKRACGLATGHLLAEDFSEDFSEN